jgi:acetone carboxylase gamma subunit
MDDLPWWKVKRVFKVVKNAEIFQSGLAVMGDLPR